MFSIIGTYFFIIIGFIAKKSFKELNEKSFVIISIYFLQPFLTLWGLTLEPIEFKTIQIPIIYLLIIFLSLIFTYFLSKSLEKKDRNIATITALIGNTGNLGIPLSMALWGDTGAFYAIVLNITNIFFMYSFGIFFYAGKFSLENIKKIFKIPIIYIAFIAIYLNYTKIDLSLSHKCFKWGHIVQWLFN